MEKIPQERGLLNKLREHADITGKLLESINPKFNKMMANFVQLTKNTSVRRAIKGFN